MQKQQPEKGKASTAATVEALSEANPYQKESNMQDSKVVEVSSQPVFSFGEHSVRVAVRDGEPWFVAKDVMVALEYSGHSAPAKVCEHIPGEWKGVNPIHTPGGQQNMLCLSEPGLYFFLGRSDKPNALPFQKWVYGQVLPAIRKTGRYEAPGKEMTVNEMVDKMTRLLGTGNSYPPILFMPLVNAVMRKQGYTFFLPPQQAQEITERLDRLSMVFHPLSSPASDVFAIGRALRGLNPKSSAEEPGYRQVLPPVAGTAFFRQVEPGVLVRA